MQKTDLTILEIQENKDYLFDSSCEITGLQKGKIDDQGRKLCAY